MTENFYVTISVVILLITVENMVQAQPPLVHEPKRMSNLCMGLRDHVNAGTVNANTFDLLCRDTAHVENDVQLFDSSLTTATSFQARYKETQRVRELKNRLKKEGKYNERYMAATIEEAAMNFVDMTDIGYIKKAEISSCDASCAIKTEQAVLLFQQKGKHFPTFKKTTRQYTPPPINQPEHQNNGQPKSLGDKNLETFVTSFLPGSGGTNPNSSGGGSSRGTGSSSGNGSGFGGFGGGGSSGSNGLHGNDSGSNNFGGSGRNVVSKGHGTITPNPTKKENPDQNQNFESTSQSDRSRNGQSSKPNGLDFGQAASSLLSGVQSMGALVGQGTSSKAMPGSMTGTTKPNQSNNGKSASESEHHKNAESENLDSSEHVEKSESDLREFEHHDSSSFLHAFNQSSSEKHNLRHKRKAPQTITSLSPMVIGARHVLYCKPPGGQEILGFNTLCGSCRAFRLLPEDYFPRYINEVTCSATKCIAGGGDCMERFVEFKILRNIGTLDLPNWVDYTLSVATCCNCMISTQLADLFQISTLVNS